MSIPTALEIRKFLEGYCVETESTLVLSGNTINGSPVVDNIDTRQLKQGMRLSGVGIPIGAKIQSIDNIGSSGQITMDVNATANGTGIVITVTFYDTISDEWIAKRRDNMIIPYVENVIGTNIREIQEIEEYYSGNGMSTLILNRRPIIEITNITYTTIPAESQTGNLLLSVELIKEEGILKSKSNFNEGSFDPIFSKGTNNIKITYKYGYTNLVDEDSIEAIDLCECIIMMVASRILNHIGARTGGGSISGTNWSRQFGDRGKYTDIINELDKASYSILRKYTSGVVGA